MMEKQITFLCGAGCEGYGQLELPSGKSFKRDTIVADKVTDLYNFLNSNNNIKLKNGTILVHNSTSVLYQTVVECDEKNLDLMMMK